MTTQLTIDELEDADDVRLYDKAKKEGHGERMLFDDYVKLRKSKYLEISMTQRQNFRS